MCRKGLFEIIILRVGLHPCVGCGSSQCCNCTGRWAKPIFVCAQTRDKRATLRTFLGLGANKRHCGWQGFGKRGQARVILHGSSKASIGQACNSLLQGYLRTAHKKGFAMQLNRRSFLIGSGAAAGLRAMPALQKPPVRRVLTLVYDKSLGMMRAVEQVVR